MTDKEKFIALLGNEKLKKSDAIVLLQGDGLFRCAHAVELYNNGWAKKIVISGGIIDRGYGSFPVNELKLRLLKLGVKQSDILINDKSMNTRDQAINTLILAKEKKWKKIILVASHYHQYRAFLTFLQAMKNAKIKIQIINSSANDLPWFFKNKWGNRMDLLESEFNKIELYKKNSHIASFAEAIKYQEWKEVQK